ncbi:hypothetical protein [Cupriavidus basilensis]|uniref:hypothetical protein n=1 Tax=Cupriavidus basilensis TaxID=68895 RepID=UPI003A598BE2
MVDEVAALGVRRQQHLAVPVENGELAPIDRILQAIQEPAWTPVGNDDGERLPVAVEQELCEADHQFTR